MNIEKGKFYRTRTGNKVEIYSTDNPGTQPIHGRIFAEGFTLMCRWMQNGRIAPNGPHEAFDLVSEWQDEAPKLDLRTLPMWRYLAQDESGNWFAYENKPIIQESNWIGTNPKPVGVLGFTGHWTNSLYRINQDRTLRRVTE